MLILVDNVAGVHVEAVHPDRVMRRRAATSIVVVLVASNAERAATLVRALEASVGGDSTIIAGLYTDDVRGRAPAFSVSSAAELAVELEDRSDAFSDIELDVSPFDVADDRACVEWVVTLTHSGPLALDDEIVIGPTGVRATMHGVTVAEFDGDKISSFRQYWDEAELLEQLK